MVRPSGVGGAAGGRTAGRRRDQGGGGGGGDKWLTTYADAVTLLMAFFVLLYAMSEVDIVKFTAFLEGLRVPFGNEAGAGLLPETDGLEPESDPTPPLGDMARADTLQMKPEDRPAESEEQQPPQQEQDQRPPTPEDVLAALERQQAQQDQLEQIRRELAEALQEFGLESYVQQRREERGLVVSIASDDVLFELGSTRIGPLGSEVIRVVSQTLDGFPNPLLVEGHTDNVPLDRAGYTNWNLSTDRAVAVLTLMIEEHELPPTRVGAVGYGEYHPYADNASAAGRARNRRVDIVVLVEEAAL